MNDLTSFHTIELNDLDRLIIPKAPRRIAWMKNRMFDVIVDTGFVKKDDIKLFTDKEWWDFEAFVVPSSMTNAGLMVFLGIFPSKGQARKAGWPDTPLPNGWNEIKIGQNRIFLWKPVE